MQIEINRIEYEEMETRETMDFDAFKNFSNKIKWINLFFIITVVAMHCVREWETYYGSSDSVISSFLINLEVYAMACFFMMSGFWLFYEYEKYTYFEMIRKKIYSILVPYILWGVLNLIIVQAVSLVETGQMKYSALDSIKSLLFIQIGTINFQPLNDPLWYLIRIMTYFIVAPVLYYLIKNKVVGAISLLVLAMASSSFGYYSFGRWLFVFCFGGYIGLHYKENIIKAANRSRGISLTFTLLIYIALCALYPYFNRYELLKNSDDVIAIIIILGIIILGKNPSIQMRHSNYSFMLYCSHMIWMAYLVKIVNAMMGKWVDEGICQGIVVLVCGFGVAIIYLVLKKFMPGVYRVLAGGRDG